ncbi:hypothetical protein ElyMa_000272400 [Elysia marginata]|uniref:Uncharacterized protein n=1 Tax=Elysia marginata TaxID=1093978 RepID=A0AAV4F6A6_9GAST|nr:hypothetical protein ElyMa_000272400 [Elysia marginata]
MWANHKNLYVPQLDLTTTNHIESYHGKIKSLLHSKMTLRKALDVLNNYDTHLIKAANTTNTLEAMKTRYNALDSDPIYQQVYGNVTTFAAKLVMQQYQIARKFAYVIASFSSSAHKETTIDLSMSLSTVDLSVSLSRSRLMAEPTTVASIECNPKPTLTLQRETTDLNLSTPRPFSNQTIALVDRTSISEAASTAQPAASFDLSTSAPTEQPASSVDINVNSMIPNFSNANLVRVKTKGRPRTKQNFTCRKRKVTVPKEFCKLDAAGNYNMRRSWESNPRPPDYKFDAFSTEPRCSTVKGLIIEENLGIKAL